MFTQIYTQDKDGEQKKYPPFEEGHEYGSTTDGEHITHYEIVDPGAPGSPAVNVPIEPIPTDDEGDDKKG
jgi:hypothetical protein